MEKCLFTKLKGSVDANLPYYGGVSVFLKKSTGSRLGSLKCLPGQTAILKDINDGTEIELSDSVQINTSQLDNVDWKEYVWISKYDAIPIVGSTGYTTGIKFDIGDFAMIDPAKLTKVALQGFDKDIYGNFDDLPASEQLTFINVTNTLIEGNLGLIVGKYPNLGYKPTQEEVVINMYESLITGDVSAFSVLNYMPDKIYMPKLATGNIYDAIVGWRQRIGSTGTSGTMMGGSGIHLWSVYPGIAKTCTVSWTATTSSITANSVTTTFDNEGNIIS